jgi:hypothetical protein
MSVTRSNGCPLIGALLATNAAAQDWPTPRRVPIIAGVATTGEQRYWKGA